VLDLTKGSVYLPPGWQQQKAW